MKNYVKYAIMAVALVAIVVLAVLGYNYLSSRYQPEKVNQKPPVVSSESSRSTSKNDNSTDLSTSDIEESTDFSVPDIERAPDFTVSDVNGNKVKLSDFYGKPIVINFWATWCGPCKSELPAFDKLYNENKENVVFLMVNLTDGYRDTVSGVKSFVFDNGYTFPLYFDTEYAAANAYSVSSIPMTVFIDKNGAFYDAQIGAMSESTLRNNLSNLLNG